MRAIFYVFWWHSILWTKKRNKQKHVQPEKPTWTHSIVSHFAIFHEFWNISNLDKHVQVLLAHLEIDFLYIVMSALKSWLREIWEKKIKKIEVYLVFLMTSCFGYSGYHNKGCLFKTPLLILLACAHFLVLSISFRWTTKKPIFRGSVRKIIICSIVNIEFPKSEYIRSSL